MKRTARPGLPSTTPFSANGCILDAPWHSRHALSLSASRDVDEKTHMSTGTLLTKFSTQSKRKLRMSASLELDRDSMSDVGSFLSDEGSFKMRSANLTGCQLDAVRSELSKKIVQAESIHESTQLAYARMKTVDTSIEQLKELIVEKDRIAASRQRSVDKLISINMMLIDTLAALGLQPSTDNGLSEMMLRLRSDILPLIKRKSEGAQSLVKTTNDDIHAVNSKLKEGLLIMSREYYGSKKNMKSIFVVS